MEPVKPQISPLEKTAWICMLAAFFIVLLAGVAFFAALRTGNPLYVTARNYLVAAGLLVYILGRVLRWRGRSKRSS